MDTNTEPQINSFLLLRMSGLSLYQSGMMTRTSLITPERNS